MKKLCLLLILMASALPSFADHSVPAVLDPNHNPSMIGVTSSGYTRPVAVDANGDLILTPNTTVYVNVAQTVNQGTAGAALWPVSTQASQTVGKSYVYVSSSVVSASVPMSLGLTGVGSGWSVQSAGSGNATFYISGSTITVYPNQKVSGDFKFLATNPTFYVTTLTSGTTLHILIEGAH